MDIFEKIKSIVGCMYISDLRFAPYREMVPELLKELNADSNQMLDVCNYIGMGGI